MIEYFGGPRRVNGELAVQEEDSVGFVEQVRVLALEVLLCGALQRCQRLRQAKPQQSQSRDARRTPEAVACFRMRRSSERSGDRPAHRSAFVLAAGQAAARLRLVHTSLRHIHVTQLLRRAEG